MLKGRRSKLKSRPSQCADTHKQHHVAQDEMKRELFNPQHTHVSIKYILQTRLIFC